MSESSFASPTSPESANLGIGRALRLVFFVTLFAKASGFIRDTCLAAVYGLRADIDAYYIAQTIPIVIFCIIGAAIGTAIVPLLSRVTNDETLFGRTAWNLFHAALLTCIAIGAPLWIFRNELVHLIAPEISAARHEEILRLYIWVLPGFVFLILTGWATGVLHAHRRFLSAAAMSLPYNAILVVGILCGRSLGIESVAAALLIACASQFLIQLPSVLKVCGGYQFHFDPHDLRLRAAFAGILPLTLNSLFLTSAVAFERSFGLSCGAGVVAAMVLARSLLTVFAELVSQPLCTSSYPYLAQFAAQRDWHALHQLTQRLLVGLSRFTIPAAFALATFARPIVTLLFQRGAFDAEATQRTTHFVLLLALSLPALGVREILTRVTTILGCPRIALLAGATTFGASLALNYWGIPLWGATAIPLSALASTYAGSGVLLVWYYRRSRCIKPIFDTPNHAHSVAA